MSLGLEYTFSANRVATLTFIWVPITWSIAFHPLTAYEFIFELSVLVVCSIFLDIPHIANLIFLISELRLSALMVITDNTFNYPCVIFPVINSYFPLCLIVCLAWEIHSVGLHGVQVLVISLFSIFQNI